MYLKIQNPNSKKILKVYTGGAVFKGCVAVLSSTTAVLGAASISTGVMLGIFLEDQDTASVGLIQPFSDDSVVEGIYTGTSKTSLTDADLGKVIDIVVSTTTTTNDTQKFNLDDLAGPFQIVGYDNDAKKVWCKPLLSCRYI